MSELSTQEQEKTLRSSKLEQANKDLESASYPRHKILIKDFTEEASQFFPFYIECSCGFQSRVGSRVGWSWEENLNNAVGSATNHLKMRALVERPR